MATSVQLKTTADVLLNIGIFPNLDSFQYLQDAVEYINTLPPHVPMPSTGEVYQHIASKYKGRRWQQIERAIRHATSLVYDHPTSLLNEVCGQYNSYKTGKISAGQFVFAIALYCHQHHIERYSSAYLSREQIRLEYIDRLIAEHYPEYTEELAKCES